MKKTLEVLDLAGMRNRRWVRSYSYGSAKIMRSKGGWGINYNPNTTRPWAVFLSNKVLRNETGKIRTFGSAEAAAKAIDKL